MRPGRRKRKSQKPPEPVYPLPPMPEPAPPPKPAVDPNAWNEPIPVDPATVLPAKHTAEMIDNWRRYQKWKGNIP